MKNDSSFGISDGDLSNVSLIDVVQSSSVNLTTKRDVSPQWTLIPIFYIVTAVVGFLGNGTILFLFAWDRTLRRKYKAFNVYVVNLLSANMCCILVMYPLSIITHIYPTSWYLGEPACGLLIYALDVLEAVVINSHALIAVARVWAVVDPITYRDYHSIRVALITCLVVWVYLHVFMAPRIILDALYYRLPVATHGCQLNVFAQKGWSIAELLVNYLLPTVVILLAFPTILGAKILRRMNGAAVGPKSADISAVGGLPMVPKVRQRSVPTDQPSVLENARRATGKYHMLAALTVSVTVCWSPLLIFFSLVHFRPRYWDTTWFQVGTVMYTCQTMLDPVLFTLTFSRVWEALKRLLTDCYSGCRGSWDGWDGLTLAS
ncbi:hypothetical protein BV898_06129 [Hypsibius exemplaris]|uniref:G-protein coupled receptors family 1 profile domain-containing protein n=1 Tax=Hypsibius exemplaris TaxID=2072580 RepID=A0A1W0WXC3_HYPEX|nr:hypothetical protein BV898_06129 [Hypsibius exemplaris]